MNRVLFPEAAAILSFTLSYFKTPQNVESYTEILFLNTNLDTCFRGYVNAENAEFSHTDYIGVLHWQRISREAPLLEGKSLRHIYCIISFFPSWGTFLASVLPGGFIFPSSFSSVSTCIFAKRAHSWQVVQAHRLHTWEEPRCLCLFVWFIPFRLGALEHAVVSELTLLLYGPTLSCFHGNFLSNSI